MPAAGCCCCYCDVRCAESFAPNRRFPLEFIAHSTSRRVVRSHTSLAAVHWRPVAMRSLLVMDYCAGITARFNPIRQTSPRLTLFFAIWSSQTAHCSRLCIRRTRSYKETHWRRTRTRRRYRRKYSHLTHIITITYLLTYLQLAAMRSLLVMDYPPSPLPDNTQQSH